MYSYALFIHKCQLRNLWQEAVFGHLPMKRGYFEPRMERMNNTFRVVHSGSMAKIKTMPSQDFRPPDSVKWTGWGAYTALPEHPQSSIYFLDNDFWLRYRLQKYVLYNFLPIALPQSLYRNLNKCTFKIIHHNLSPFIVKGRWKMMNWNGWLSSERL